MKTFTKLFLSGCIGALISSSAFAQPKIKLVSELKLGNSSLDVWSWVDPATKKEHVAMGVGKDLVIVDVSNPTAPKEVGRISSVPVFDEKVWINPKDNKVYVYTVSGGGNVQGGIVDVTDPSKPTKVGNFKGAHNVFIDEEQGLLGLAIPGFALYDIKGNPTQPQLLSSKGGDGHDATTVGTTLYNFNGRDATDVWDIKDPRAPKKLGGLDHPDIKYNHHGFPSKVVGEGNQYLYVCDELSTGSNDDISVLDISDPSDIKKVNGYGNKGVVHNLYVIGDYAYTSYYSEGFMMFDVTDPSKIVLVDQHDNAASTSGMGGNFGICPYGTDNKSFSNSDGKLYIYDVKEFAVGVEDDVKLENISMELGPNPSTGIFYVNITGNITSDMNPRLKITNLEGKLIKEEVLSTTGLTNRKVSLSGQPKGVYFVQLQTSKRSINKKVVIR